MQKQINELKIEAAVSCKMCARGYNAADQVFIMLTHIVFNTSIH
uniref:Uncharacterized protein n=1 Tax=Anguilla anguilla TaxID=7936 RepID=A0A0E9VD75_ANGAN